MKSAHTVGLTHAQSAASMSTYYYNYTIKVLILKHLVKYTIYFNLKT